MESIISEANEKAVKALENENVKEFNRIKHAEFGNNPLGFNLKNIDISGKVLKGIDLKNCDLSFANCKGTDFEGANLRGTITHQTEFDGANFKNCDVTDASIEESKNANLKGAIDNKKKKEKTETLGGGINTQKSDDVNEAVIQNLLSNFFSNLKAKNRKIPANAEKIATETNWEKVKRLTGIDITKISKKNAEKLLAGKKTDLLAVTRIVNGQPVEVSAKLSIGWDPDTDTYSKINLNYQKESLDLNKPYFGYKFTEEDKKNLLETGNLGKAIDIVIKDGEKPQKRFVSIDFDTNEIISQRANSLSLKDKFMGKDLTLPENQQLKIDLESGKRVFIENMDYGAHKIDAYIQYNAAKESFDFDLTKKSKQTLSLNKITKEMTRYNKLGEKTYRFKNAEFSKEDIIKLSKGETLEKKFATKEGKTYTASIKYDFKAGNLETFAPGQKIDNAIKETRSIEKNVQQTVLQSEAPKRSMTIRM